MFINKFNVFTYWKFNIVYIINDAIIRIFLIEIIKNKTKNRIFVKKSGQALNIYANDLVLMLIC